MRRLDPVYKSILNEVARDEFIPPWMNPLDPRYPNPLYPEYTNPIQRPTVKPNNPPFVEHEPNVIAPDGYTEPGQDLQVRPEITDQQIRDIEDYIQNPQNSPEPKPTLFLFKDGKYEEIPYPSNPDILTGYRKSDIVDFIKEKVE